MIVMKFGGTSMGSAEAMLQVVEIIDNKKKDNLVVVVSAMSGVTDLLLGAASDSINNSDDFESKIKEIEKKHFTLIDSVNFKSKIMEEAKSGVCLEIDNLRKYLEVVKILGEMPTKVHDKIIAIGEKLSAFLLSKILNDKGVSSDYLNLESVVKPKKDKVNDKFFKYLSKSVKEVVKKSVEKKNVPVLTGFIGEIPQGIINSLGRGYSDYTASIVGARLNAKQIEIWTDVDGIFSSDPRKILDAKIIDELTYDEAGQMAHFGAKVIHPRTIFPAIKKEIPVLILNTFNPSAPGTKIISKTKGKSIKSISARKGIKILNIVSNRNLEVNEFLSSVFSIVSNYGICIDAVSVTQNAISIAIDDQCKNFNLIKDLEKIGMVSKKIDNAIVAIIGNGMKGISGFSGKVFTIIGDKKVNIEMISQGSSELNLSFVINEKDLDKIVSALHKEIFV